MIILAIDPGTSESAVVGYDSDAQTVEFHEILANADLERRLAIRRGTSHEHACVIEMVASYGKPVGVDTFETVWWIGRFCATYHRSNGVEPERIFRKDIKRHLCGQHNGVSDAMVRQALIDKFGPGRELAVGTVKKPGPLHGVRLDEWQALAIAVYYAETNIMEPTF